MFVDIHFDAAYIYTDVKITFFSSFLYFCRYLPIENNRRIREIDQEIRTILRGIIVKRDKAVRNGEGSNDDLLGLLVESNMRQSNEKEDVGMSIEDMIEECKLFYAAGSETTSMLLTWTLILLSMHPEWQEQAREEVMHHFGRTTPDHDGLSRLKIVSMTSTFSDVFQNSKVVYINFSSF